MDIYTHAMLKIISMPRMFNVKGKSVEPGVLFSPSLLEPMLYWHASSLSMRLHDEVLMNTSLKRDDKSVSGISLVSVNKDLEIKNKKIGMGLAASLMIIAESADQLVAPARNRKNFDYAPVILGFRETVCKLYDNGDFISPKDHLLNTYFYDNIVKPARREGTGVHNKPSLPV